MLSEFCCLPLDMSKLRRKKINKKTFHLTKRFVHKHEREKKKEKYTIIENKPESMDNFSFHICSRQIISKLTIKVDKDKETKKQKKKE